MERQETAQEAVVRVLAQQAEQGAAQQAQWQALRDETAKKDEAKAKEREAAEAAKVERLQQQAAANFEAEHKPGMLAAWQATGGDHESFEKAWPAMRTQLQMDAARRTQQAAREAAGALYRDF
jgi:hypothetical protein